MSKKSKVKNQPKPNAQTTSQPQKTAASASPPKFEDLSKSTSEADFNKIKKQLLDQVQKELDKLEEAKKNIGKEIEKLGEEKEKVKQGVEAEKDALENIRKEKKPLDDEIALRKGELAEIETKAKEAEEKAKTVIDEAQARSLEIIADAEKKAENENREFFDFFIKKRDDLKNQQKELIDKSIAKQDELDAEKARLREEKHDLDIEKEVLKDERTFIEKKRERYENASPEKIKELEINLSDEKERYDVLSRIYNEQTKKYNKAQITLDSMKTNPDTSIKDLLDEYETIKKRKEELERIYEKYPDGRYNIPSTDPCYYLLGKLGKK